ncbi:MAG: NAD kinase [Actinomycetaceae bacterium]|nr:NAD kinase [Actinomycetaceae bacterium]MDY5855025.1 NAD kinase [Arcanobacterium sp.]
MNRVIAILPHEKRLDVAALAKSFHQELQVYGVAAHIVHSRADVEALERPELMVVLGGDGTILRAAELVRGLGVPILGINYGHVGFLAEVDPSSQADVVSAIVHSEWRTEQRMTIDVTVRHPDGDVITSWALNEASIEKSHGSRMIETDIGVDGEPVSSFKTDTVLLSTPTGSTAYNFSAGGPIVWPDVEAIVLTPIAAHALFTRPMVLGPHSWLDVQIRTDDALIWCDGRRRMSAPEGSSVHVEKGRYPVLLARLGDAPFSERLVKKLHLPVHGWRGQRAAGNTERASDNADRPQVNAEVGAQ